MSTVTTLHATCVAWGDRSGLIKGQSGAGKSALGLALMGLGCTLVADDAVHLTLTDDVIWAKAPDTITGLIEARGVGILKAEVQDRAQVVLIVDLDQSETARLPERRYFVLLGHNIPLIYRADAPHFAPSILQILKSGWSER